MEAFNPSTIITDFSKGDIILGIDEAGRGPTLGPMVYACAYWDSKYDKDIRFKFRFDDSKKLKPETREKMYDEICKYPNLIKFETIIISPEYLSQEMLKRQKVSLNVISQNAAVDLVLAAKRNGANITHIYVDTVGSPEKYAEHLKKKIGDDKLKITVESKADATYACVSAGSIVAKVTRDRCVEKWEFKEKEIVDRNIGSGYPSDPYTCKWLERNYDSLFGFPSFARFSWKTIKNKIKESGNNCEWENYVEEEEDKKNKYGHHHEDTEKQNLLSFQSNCRIKHFYEQNEISFDIDL